MIFAFLSGLTILLIFIVQTLFVTYLSFRGIAPSFLLLALLVFSLRYGGKYGALFGFASGMILDVFTSKLFGFEAFVFTTLGYSCGLLNHRLDESMIKVQYLVSLLMCFMYYFVAETILNLMSSGVSYSTYFRAAGSLVYTVLLTYPLYKIFNRMAERIEIWSGKANPV